MNKTYSLIFFILIFLIGGCSRDKGVTRNTTPTFSRSMTGALFVKMQSEAYIIRQGDQVELSVWGYPEFNTTTTVKKGGEIAVPLIGELKAEGQSKQQFAETLKQSLTQYIQGEPRITLSVSSPTLQRVSVLGAVVRQDNYPVTGEVSLLEVLSSAGGATPESDLHRVKILRYGGVEHPVIVDVAASIEEGAVDAVPMVRPGDTVFVPKKENVIREFSDFLRDAVLLFGFFRVFY